MANGLPVAGFAKMSGFEKATEFASYREDRLPATARKPEGKIDYDAITLERGITRDLVPDLDAGANVITIDMLKLEHQGRERLD